MYKEGNTEQSLSQWESRPKPNKRLTVLTGDVTPHAGDLEKYTNQTQPNLAALKEANTPTTFFTTVTGHMLNIKNQSGFCILLIKF